jgi:uncharacterized iron-regulated membrane protein
VTPVWRCLFAIHRWLGLVLALPLAAVALSGALLAAGKPLDVWLNRALFHVPAALTRTDTAAAAVDAVHADLLQRYGATASFTLRLPQEPQESLRVFVNARGFSGQAFYDSANARWLGQRHDLEGWWPWLFELHSNALSGERGKSFLSIIAAGTLILATLGGALWWRGRGTRALAVAWRAPPQRRWRDLHRVAGAGALPLLLAIVMSGVYMTWKPIRAGVSQLAGQPPIAAPRLPATAQNTADKAAVALSALLFSARARWPDGHVVYLTLRAGQPVRVRVRLPHDLHPNGLSSVWFDPRDGRELARVPVDALDAGQRWVGWIYPLHSAQLFGTAQRIAWTAAGGVLVALAGSGSWLWWRNRRMRRPPPAAGVYLR